MVAPAEEAPRGPGRRLGDGDPGVQVVHAARGAEDVAGVVGNGVGRVAVEGPHQRRPAVAQRIPGHHRDDRLVHVHHVEAPAAQCCAQGGHRIWRDGHVRERPVEAEGDAASERDHAPVGVSPLRPGAPVQQARAAIVGIHRSQDADLVSHQLELGPESVDVAGYAPGIRPRVGGHERDAHHRHSTSRARLRPAARAGQGASLYFLNQAQRRGLQGPARGTAAPGQAGRAGRHPVPGGSCRCASVTSSSTRF